MRIAQWSETISLIPFRLFGEVISVLQNGSLAAYDWYYWSWNMKLELKVIQFIQITFSQESGKKLSKLREEDLQNDPNASKLTKMFERNEDTEWLQSITYCGIFGQWDFSI